jgi:hypothetical protein
MGDSHGHAGRLSATVGHNKGTATFEFVQHDDARRASRDGIRGTFC